MDAQTIYSLLKPQLRNMEEEERKSLSNLIAGNHASKFRSRVLSVKEAKEKIKLYRRVEMQRDKLAK